MGEIGQQVGLYTCHRADGSPSAARQIYIRGFLLHPKKGYGKNNLGIPDHHIASFAKGIYPLMVKYFESAEGQRELAAYSVQQVPEAQPTIAPKQEALSAKVAWSPNHAALIQRKRRQPESGGVSSLSYQ